MKYFFPVVLLLFHSAIVAAPAPDFRLNDTQLSQLKGKVVYLDFWASWCQPCRKSFPWMNHIADKYADQGLVVLAINLDKDRQLADQFLEKLPANFKVLFDPQGNVAQQYALPGMPTSYLIDKTGQLRIAHKGFFEQQQDRYEQELTVLLNE